LISSALASANFEGRTVEDVVEDLMLREAPGPAWTLEDPVVGQPVDDTLGTDRLAGASDDPDSTRITGVAVGLILSAVLIAQRLAAGRPWWEVALFVIYGMPVCCFLLMIIVAKLAGVRRHQLWQQSAQAVRGEVIPQSNPS
jgi:hypothetical protein